MLNKLPIEEDYAVIAKFFESFEQQHEDIEKRCIFLERNPSDFDEINQLRQALKNLCFNAISCNISPMVEPLEILVNFLDKSIAQNHYSSCYSEAIMLLMDRFLLMAREAVHCHAINFELIQEVQEAIEPMSHVTQTEEMDDSALRTIQRLMGQFAKPEEQDLPGVELFSDESHVTPPPPLPAAKIKRGQFSVFKILSETADYRHKYWRGRTEFILPMAMGMNALADNAVDLAQLEGAIYIHDFAMTRLSDEILYKKKLDPSEFEHIKQHPAQAYELAMAAGNWEECAQIVYQHHERPDGSGYPEGIEAAQICEGAKILAICDAFHAMTHKQAHKPNRRSIIRAIAEINACRDKQFSGEWVDRFNIIVRTQRIAGAM